MVMLLDMLCGPAHRRFYAVLITGVLFCILGSAGIVLSIVELFRGRPSVYHYDENRGGLTIENPLWPSAGKGFWVGLVLIATGLVGILASRERTPPALVGFTALASVSTVLSFYLVMTAIVPVQYQTKYSNDQRPSWQLVELIVNALLIVVGVCGSILGALVVLYGMVASGFCANQRPERVYEGDDVKLCVTVPNERLRYGGLQHPASTRFPRPVRMHNNY